MSRFVGRTLHVFNECSMGCSYCGYPKNHLVRLDLDAVEREGRAIVARGEETLIIASKDPVEHPQFPELVTRLLEFAPRMEIETAGLALREAVRRREAWALDRRIKWKIPLLSDDPERHDRIVGRPGHHAVVREIFTDRALDVGGQMLLVRESLAPGNLRRTLALAHDLDRDIALRHFTPRALDDLDYYRRSVPRLWDLWRELSTAVAPAVAEAYLSINPQCYPPCVVPAPLQGRHLAHHVARVRPGAEAVEDSSLSDLEPCPREAECAFGSACLGIYRSYRQVHGDGEFQPSNVQRGALDALLWSGALKSAVEARRQLRSTLQQLVGLGGINVAATTQEDPERLLRFLQNLIDDEGDTPRMRAGIVELGQARPDDADDLESRLRRREIGIASSNRQWRRVQDLLAAEPPRRREAQWQSWARLATAHLRFEADVERRDAPAAVRSLGELVSAGLASDEHLRLDAAESTRAIEKVGALMAEAGEVDELTATMAELVGSHPDVAEDLSFLLRRHEAGRAAANREWDRVYALLSADPVARRDSHWARMYTKARIQRLFADCVRRRQARDVPGALRLLEEILALEPADPNALRMRREMGGR